MDKIKKLTPELLRILQHSLGVDQYGFGDQYRNHYCAGGNAVEQCCELERMGYMKRHATTELFPDKNFSVTREGKAAMAEQSPRPPKLTRSQKRYAEYLRVADLFDSFGHWLKYTTRQRALEAVDPPYPGRGA